jgi:GNAT superfamily N-acetyltransferase
VIPVLAAALSRPTAAELSKVAEVFDQYRQHYGEPAVPGQTLAWLAGHLDHGRLTVFAAHLGGNLVGVATTVELPASLRLSCSWQLRDLYVVPAARRAGVARALLGAVRAAATAAGAIRLSVQTEPGNTAALQLYYSSGFLPVDDLQVLALPLHHDGA